MSISSCLRLLVIYKKYLHIESFYNFVLTDKETLKVTTTGLLGGSWLLSYSGNSQNSGGSLSNWTDLWNLDGGGGFAAWIKASLQITVSEYFINKQKSNTLKIWMFIPCFMKLD